MKFEDFIARFEPKRKTQLGYMAVCPSHDDSPKSMSLHICPARDGGVLVKCFAGCSSEQIVGALKLTMKDLFADSKLVKFIPPTAIQTTSQPEEKPVIDKIYSYQNSNGTEVYQAIRLKPKSFRQRHQSTDGKWIWNMDGVERVLYRLPEVIKTQQVWIVEGEKDAENLVQLGFCATCNVGGAGKWLDSYNDALEGKDIVICGDNDEPGQKHVAMVFESVSKLAKTVRVVKLPHSVKDASELIVGLKSADDAKQAFLDLVSEAHPSIKTKSLPIYSIAELEEDYRRFVRNMGKNSFSLGKWLPTLGIRLRSLVPGELAFIIGDTGTGKTGILQQIARAALPLTTLMFELELPKELMFERFASMISKMTGEQIEATYQSSDESISDLIDLKLPNLCICPISRITVSQMEEIIMRSELKLGERPRVVLIDYIQLISGEGVNRREKVSDIAEQLKVMAKSTRTIVIVTSQISRPQNVDDDWEPSLHSAKESGSIEASCGLLISAWQDSKDSSLLKMRVLKSTKGGTGTFVQCNFDGARMIITERAQYSDIPVTDRQQTHDP